MPSPPPIPLVDLAADHASLEPALTEAWHATLTSSAFIGGEAVEAFEAAFAKTFGHQHVVSCANGTDAIELALEALGVGPGDEVVVPAMTWFSTAEAVATRGATPVCADVDPLTDGLSPATVAPLVTDRTRAVIVVHLYGNPAHPKQLATFCEERGLALVEDCAQAHGARVGERHVGTFGAISTYSFFPSKTLGCLGDGGAVVTQDPALAETIRMLARHGQRARHRHERWGRNSRLDALQARVLSLKLPRLSGWIDLRNRHADRYRALLDDVPGLALPPPALPDHRHAYYVFAVRAARRDELAAHLRARGIHTAVHYPTPIHHQPAYRGATQQLPIAEQLGRQTLSLPLFPALTEQQQDRVAREIKAFYA